MIQAQPCAAVDILLQSSSLVPNPVPTRNYLLSTFPDILYSVLLIIGNTMAVPRISMSSCSKHGNSRFTVRGSRRMERQYGGSLHDDIPMPTKQFCLLAECIDLTNISRLSNSPIRTFQQRYYSDYFTSLMSDVADNTIDTTLTSKRKKS
ncbi:hypothetical protein V1478_017235 [Vespula squamosa]|uniref:Uncharacterized protein n=1 Tax=Vespula squamosa TaxID=30214 RepID=A0ABD1ZXE7_VESSQ